MPDEMPLQSTRYCDMTPRNDRAIRGGLVALSARAMPEFQPDVDLCQHLYLLTAIVREMTVPILRFKRPGQMSIRTGRENSLPPRAKLNIFGS